MQGGRINTDFIDNVAGVDTSDHEVNIKILLDKVVADGDLTEKQRNDIIASMTDEVAGLVLKSNYRQNIALANATAQAPALMHVHQDWVRRLEKQGLLDRELEFLPSVAEFKRRKAEGRGLTSPELSVLIAYTKIVLEAELLKTSLPDDQFLRAQAGQLLPEADPATVRRPDPAPPAAPRDHHHPGGERVREHVRDHRVPPAVAGDRRLGRGRRPGEPGRQPDLPAARVAGPQRRAGQRGRRGDADAHAAGDPAPWSSARPVGWSATGAHRSTSRS